MHMQTYTAGEDSGRLAAAAKELGLLQARKPRDNVRARTATTTTMPVSMQQLLHRMLDTGTEDARMRAIVSTHDGNDTSTRSRSLVLNGEQSLFGATANDDDAVIDPHTEGLGGDMVSAVLGIIKGMVCNSDRC